MAVGRELFKLYGKISMLGVEPLKKDLLAVEKQSKRVQRQIGAMGRKIERVGKTLTKAFTLPVLAAAAASVKFVKSASELNETISKTGEIFGESAKDIEAWAGSSADKLGQSKKMAMDAATTFAIFGKSAGMAGKDLTKFSTEFVELASDMASFFDTEPSEAITAIGAAFRGENEPIRKYGVLLDDATMRQKALELGLVTTTKTALMPQTKMLAAQALILEQTTAAQGDFKRTSAGLANSTRKLNAQFENASATLGQLFLPIALKAVTVAQKLLQKVNDLVVWWKGLDGATRTTIKGFVLLAAAMGPVLIVVGKLVVLSKVLVPLLVAIKTGTAGWAASMALLQKSVMGVTIVIGALLALGWYFYSQWDTISKQLAGIWAKMELAATLAVSGIQKAMINMVMVIIDGLAKVSDVIPGFTKKLQTAKLELLKMKASMYAAEGAARRHSNAVNEQAEANETLSASIKGAIAQGKKALGLKDETIKKTQLEVDAEKLAAAAAKKAAEDRKNFNADILLQLEKQGADKFALLEVERRQAVENATALKADVLKVEELYIQKRKELEKADAEERAAFEQSSQDRLNQIQLSKLELLELEKNETLAKAEELGAEKEAITTLYALREAELKDELRKQEAQKEEAATKKRFSMLTGFAGKLNGILGKFSSNRMTRIDQESKRKIEAVNSSTLNEEEKAARIEQIEEQTDRKRRAMERRAAVRNKFKALFDIAINTASAAVEALPNLPLSFFVGGLGAVSAGAVASEPLPQLQEGALIEGTEKGVLANIGEKGTDEIVFPLDRGVGLMVDAFIERLGNISIPGFAAPELAGAGAGDNQTTNLNIGTFIGDRRGLKTLERKLDTIRISENQRKGVQ